MFENADALRKLAALNPTPNGAAADGDGDLNLQLIEAVKACDVEHVRRLGAQGARPTHPPQPMLMACSPSTLRAKPRAQPWYAT